MAFDLSKFHIFKIAVTLVKHHGWSLENAVLAPWYIVHRDPPKFSYFQAEARTQRCIPGNPFTDRELSAYRQALALGPNPWPMYRDDPTYCRQCFRVKIYRRLRCYRCYMRRDRSISDPPKLCRVPGCTSRRLAQGRCRRHYQAAYRAGTLWRPAEEHDLPMYEGIPVTRDYMDR